MMKAFLLIVVALFVTIDANLIRRKCVCKVVSSDLHIPFHSWDVSSCYFCSCDNLAMTNCETLCKTAAENYAKAGCGAILKGSMIRYSWEASSCSGGLSQVQYKCA